MKDEVKRELSTVENPFGRRFTQKNADFFLFFSANQRSLRERPDPKMYGREILFKFAWISED
jgi:hypothetical protein